MGEIVDPPSGGGVVPETGAFVGDLGMDVGVTVVPSPVGMRVGINIGYDVRGVGTSDSSCPTGLPVGVTGISGRAGDNVGLFELDTGTGGSVGIAVGEAVNPRSIGGAVGVVEPRIGLDVGLFDPGTGTGELVCSIFGDNVGLLVDPADVVEVANVVVVVVVAVEDVVVPVVVVVIRTGDTVGESTPTGACVVGSNVPEVVGVGSYVGVGGVPPVVVAPVVVVPVEVAPVVVVVVKTGDIVGESTLTGGGVVGSNVPELVGVGPYVVGDVVPTTGLSVGIGVGGHGFGGGVTFTGNRVGLGVGAGVPGILGSVGIGDGFFVGVGVLGPST